MKGLNKAKKIGSLGVINTLKIKKLLGRGGAAFPTAKKWEYALTKDSDEKYVICNADEGEPGTFKDKMIINNNTDTLIEGILIACYTIRAKKAFIYLRGEYGYLKTKLEKTIKTIKEKACYKADIHVILGAGAYVCGDETAIIRSIEGKRGHPYYKPPFPPIEGLWKKPTIINNVETLTNVPQALLFEDWNPNLRLFSISGNVTKPGVYELEVGTNLKEIIRIAEPRNKVKAVYFGCFGGCMPYKEIELTPENVCGINCAIGAFTIIIIDDKQSILKVAKSIAQFYRNESCGKCTPCREGTKRILDLIVKIQKKKASREDLDTLRDLSEQISQTSLCGLGQTATNHVLTALDNFHSEFEERINEN